MNRPSQGGLQSEGQQGLLKLPLGIVREVNARLVERLDGKKWGNPARGNPIPRWEFAKIETSSRHVC
jgi:hypothetical protein